MRSAVQHALEDRGKVLPLLAIKSTVAVQPRSILFSAKDGDRRHVPVALFREIETYFIGSPAQSPRHRLHYSRSPRHLPTTLLP